MVLGTVARAVLVARGAVAYGGRLSSDGYTAFLVHELERYVRDRSFTGFVAYSEHASMSSDEIQAAVKGIGLTGRYVFLDPDGQVIDDRQNTAGVEGELDRDLVIRSLSGLRRQMTEETDARVLIGGQRTGYQGRIPGVVEETILAIQAGKPMYIAGGFGGAAGDIASLLGLDPEGWLGIPPEPGRADLEELRRVAMAEGWEPTSNGLTVEQNHQLAVSYRASEIASLVVRGLINAFDED